MQALINFLARFINATKDAFNVQLSGSNLKWTPLSIVNTDAGTEKTITVPAGKEYWVKHIQTEFVSTAVVGNRALKIMFNSDAASSTAAIDTAGNVFPLVAASLTKRAIMGVGYPTETAYSGDTNACKHPMPDIILRAGEKIFFTDYAAIDRTNDTFKYYVRVLERSV